MFDFYLVLFQYHKVCGLRRVSKVFLKLYSSFHTYFSLFYNFLKWLILVFVYFLIIAPGYCFSPPINFLPLGMISLFA